MGWLQPRRKREIIILGIYKLTDCRAETEEKKFMEDQQEQIEK